ncbi:MAG TPA: hypothetical protein VFT90_09385, partial [Chryseosolibacter sp.]|nr:hypothetical protein [Chryseosolibacter sp.]
DTIQMTRANIEAQCPEGKCLQRGTRYQIMFGTKVYIELILFFKRQIANATTVLSSCIINVEKNIFYHR